MPEWISFPENLLDHGNKLSTLVSGWKIGGNRVCALLMLMTKSQIFSFKSKCDAAGFASIRLICCLATLIPLKR